MASKTNVFLGAFLIILGGALIEAGIIQCHERMLIRVMLVTLGVFVFDRGMIHLIGRSLSDFFKK